MARTIPLEAVRHWAAASLISVGMESPDDVNIIVGMLRDRGVIVNGSLRRLVLPECWQTPYDGRMHWLTLEPLDSSAVDSPQATRDVRTMRSSKQESCRNENGEFLVELVGGLPALTWRAAAGGYWVWASPQWSEFTGVSGRASRGRGWLKAVHADDRKSVVTAFEQAEKSGRFHVACRLRCAADGRWRWCQSHAVRRRLATSHDVAEEWLGLFIDVSDPLPAKRRSGRSETNS